jgi:peptidoglycan/LPS O-acetylase OafA/YrhL
MMRGRRVPDTDAARPAADCRIDALTGIRGAACLWVVALHAYPIFEKLFDLMPEDRVPLVRSGYLAVDMFFILSGFILTYKYDGKLVAPDRRELSAFYISRIFRIFPLHWFMLSCLLATAYLLPSKHWAFDRLDWNAFVASVFLVQSWGFADPLAWNFPAWSMSAEWAAYLLFPVMLVTLRGRRADHALGCAAASIAALVVVMITLGQSTLDHTNLLALPRCILQFAMGAFLCRYCRATPGISTPPMLPAGLLLLAIAVFLHPLELVAPIAFCLVILACAQGGRWPQILFGNRVILFLGEISFSLYLTHAFLIYILQIAVEGSGLYSAALASRIMFSAAMIVVLLAIPVATWRYIELPGQALGRRVNRAVRSPHRQGAQAVA